MGAQRVKEMEPAIPLDRVSLKNSKLKQPGEDIKDDLIWKSLLVETTRPKMIRARRGLRAR